MAETMLGNDAGLSLSEISRRTGGVYSAVHREVSRLVEAGILAARTEGRNRMVVANVEHPLHRPLVEILTWAYGPEPVMRGLLSEASGVEYAAIYGSWAARRSGDVGVSPNDIDVLLVGSISRRDASRIAAEATATLGTQVNATVLRPEEWAADTKFTKTVKNRPLVELLRS